jgi:hypothetical protein
MDKVQNNNSTQRLRMFEEGDQITGNGRGMYMTANSDTCFILVQKNWTEEIQAYMEDS